jgi:hypothetical protein
VHRLIGVQKQSIRCMQRNGVWQMVYKFLKWPKFSKKLQGPLLQAGYVTVRSKNMKMKKFSAAV